MKMNDIETITNLKDIVKEEIVKSKTADSVTEEIAKTKKADTVTEEITEPKKTM